MKSYSLGDWGVENREQFMNMIVNNMMKKKWNKTLYLK